MPGKKINSGTESCCDTWTQLNEVMQSADEPTCWKMIRAEMAGRRRQEFIYRIHSRLNRVRAHYERQALQGVLENTAKVSSLKWLK